MDAIELVFGILATNGLATISSHLADQKGPNPHGLCDFEILDAVVQKYDCLGIGRLGNSECGLEGFGGMLGGQIAALDVDNIHKQILDPEGLETSLGVVSDAGGKNVFWNARIDAQNHFPQFLIFGKVLKDRNLVNVSQILINGFVIVGHEALRQESLQCRPVILVQLVGLSRRKILFWPRTILQSWP